MSKDDQLRQRAEDVAVNKSARSLENIAALMPENTQHLLHELKVHQIELEMQNDELRRAYVQIDIARKHYFDFYNLAPVGYITLSEHGLILEANQVVCTWLGMNKKELYTKPISHIVLQEDHNAFYLFRKKIITNSTSQECELRIVNHGGASFWMRLIGIAAKDESEQPIIRIVLNNIVERKQNESLLSASEHRFRSFVENLNDALFVLSPSGIFSYVSPQWEKAFGYELSETIGQAFHTFVHTDDVPVCFAFLKKIIETGEKQNGLEYRVRCKDGRYVWYKANASLIKDPLSNETSLVCIGRDISDRRQMNALRVSEERFRQMFDRAGEGILIVGRDGKIVAVNHSYAQMHGFTVEEMQDMHLRDLDSPESSRVEAVNIARILSGESLTFEMTHYHKDGHLFSVELSSSPVDINGENLLQIFVRNITERKLAQAELKKFADTQQRMAMQLQSALDGLRIQTANAGDALEKEKAHIARELHDELGQLLAAARLDIELIKMEYGEKVPELQPKTIKMLETMDRALVSMRRAVTHLRPSILDMGLLPALEWLRDDFAKMFGITCQLSCSDMSVRMGNEQLTVVFRITQESLTNIAKHSKASFVHINVQVRHNILLLSIQDNGIGFDFDFNRDAARRRSQSFGLQGMRERIMAFNGDLVIDTAPGKGCCVHLSIPVGGVNCD